MGFNEILTKLFGNKSQRDLKEITPYVDRVKAAYPATQKLTDDCATRRHSAPQAKSLVPLASFAEIYSD